MGQLISDLLTFTIPNLYFVTEMSLCSQILHNNFLLKNTCVLVVLLNILILSGYDLFLASAVFIQMHDRRHCLVPFIVTRGSKWSQERHCLTLFLTRFMSWILLVLVQMMFNLGMTQTVTLLPVMLPDFVTSVAVPVIVESSSKIKLQRVARSFYFAA